MYSTCTLCVCAEKWSDDGMVVATKWMMIKSPWRIQTSVKYPGKKTHLAFFSSLEIINCILLYSGVSFSLWYIICGWTMYAYVSLCMYLFLYILLFIRRIQGMCSKISPWNFHSVLKFLDRLKKKKVLLFQCPFFYRLT